MSDSLLVNELSGAAAELATRIVRMIDLNETIVMSVDEKVLSGVQLR